MDEKKTALEALSLEMAEKHGVTQADAAWTISTAMTVFEDIKDALVAIAQTLSGVVSQVWGSVRECVEKNEPERSSNRQVWPIVWDTRKKSQVLSNKPRFLIRKIIG